MFVSHQHIHISLHKETQAQYFTAAAQTSATNNPSAENVVNSEHVADISSDQ